MIIAQNSTPTIVFLLVSADDGVTAMSGVESSVQVQIAKNGGSFTGITGSVAEMGNGWYKFELNDAETDVEGALIVVASADGTLEWRDLHQVYSSFDVTLVAGMFNQIADHVLRRDFAGASASGDGDEKGFRSLLGSVAKSVNRVELAGTTLSIYEADDSTVLGTQSVVTNQNATPITGVDTD